MSNDQFGPRPTMEQIEEVVDEIKPILRGKGALMIGAVLVDLTATFFAGHNPKIRGEAVDAWVSAMKGLINVNEKELMEHYGTTWEELNNRPKDS